MLDSKKLRKETELVIQNLSRRGFNFDLKKWENLELQRKELQAFNENQQSKLNDISKEIGLAKKESNDTSKLQKEASKLTAEIKNQTKQLDQLLTQINEFVMSLPNLIDTDVPDGKDETENLEIRKDFLQAIEVCLF